MKKRNIIVIGASAGGFEAIKELVLHLPSNLEASIFIVWHMSPDVEGVLPQVITRLGSIKATGAKDMEKILPNHIYVAPPDHHLLIEGEYMRVTHGPKENRFRPAVDPLFRSAAYYYGSQVIGIILSGALDDGTSGLWTIKHYGGTAIVQNPEEAVVTSMPENAIREVEVDHIATIQEIAKLLVTLTSEEIDENENEVMREERTNIEIKIAAEKNALESGIMKYGEPTNFTCPECHGTLSAYIEGNRVRYRCHTGHAYSVNTLLAAITEKVEANLYNALRAVEESIMMLNNIGDSFAEQNTPKLAALYFTKAKEAQFRGNLVRKAIIGNEALSKDYLLHAAEATVNNSSDRAFISLPTIQNGQNGTN